MKEFSVIMALVDFIPVILFGISAVILMRDLYNKMSKGVFAIFSAGMIDIVCAGTLKALYKLLYAANVCDFEALNKMFFPVQSLGFLLAGLGILAMMLSKRNKKAVLAVAPPPVFTGTFIFVAFMVSGIGVITTVLSILSFKLKKPALTVLFALTFLCLLAMGYLSSKDFTSASMNWIAEIAQVFGQACMLTGTILLHKAGCAELSLEKADSQNA